MDGKFDPRLEKDHVLHKEYVDRIQRLGEHFRKSCLNIWDGALDHWDRFLAIQEDTRDPVDEKWRSQIFVPMPFATTRTKVAQQVELLGNTEPVWQVEATREDPRWIEQSKPIERLIDYTHTQNNWRKYLSKALTIRSVVGHTWL